MAYLLIAITEALIVIGLGTIIFQVGLVNNPITLLLGTLIFLIDSVMFGLLVGVRSNNQNSAVQIISLVGFITSLLLSRHKLIMVDIMRYVTHILYSIA